MTKVLLVGCGGIGCEVAKLLALKNLEHVHLIDLDTIELSNLNRQFIFKSSDIGKHKAKVLSSWLQDRYKDRGFATQVTYSLEPVPNEACSPSFVAKFDVVINALDNIAARSAVNKLCRFAYAAGQEWYKGTVCRVGVGLPGGGVPLIDAGTSGIRGTCMTYHSRQENNDANATRHVCFDCFPPPPPKSLPVCTVRTFPTSPEHCITFALSAFQRLFGASGSEDMGDQGDMSDLPHIESSTWVDKESGCVYAKKVLEDSIAAVNTLCGEAVSSVAQMTKGSGVFSSPPTPLSPLLYEDVWNSLEKSCSGVEQTTVEQPGEKLVLMLDKIMEDNKGLSMSFQPIHTDTLPLILVSSIMKIGLDEARTGIAQSFSKDIDSHLLYLISFSILRMRSFSIRSPSPFDIVGIGGNVIPAVATINSAVAGLAVMEIDALENKHYTCHETFISPTGKPLFTIDSQEASPTCLTCSRPVIVVRSLDDDSSDILEHTSEEILLDVVNAISEKWKPLSGSVELYKKGILLNKPFKVGNSNVVTEDETMKSECNNNNDDDGDCEDDNFWDLSDEETENNKEENKETKNGKTFLKDLDVTLAVPLTLMVGEEAFLICFE